MWVTTATAASSDDGYGPHAVWETSDGVAYQYDANGNMEREYYIEGKATKRSLRYSTFDKPLWIEKDGHVTEFQYAPDRSRYLRIDTDSSDKRTETRYIGNVEKITRPDDTVEIKRYLPGGAVVTITAGKRESRYLHKDHLGSVDVITDFKGSVVQEMSFDAWGQRRNAQSWDALITAELKGFDSSLTTRGYTGHEMLDQVGLIHMNGRIYDPRLGRFLQADPFVQAASDTQMFNRYSYARNNPLNATDPSGHFLELFAVAASIWLDQQIIKAMPDPMAQMVQIIGTAVTSAVCGPCSIGWNAYFSAQRGYAKTGDFGEALRAGAISGISSAAFYAVGTYVPEGTERIFAHAMVGGVMAELQGGKFGHGFAAAGFTALAADAGLMGEPGQGPTSEGTLTAAVIGGTASVLSGGKFANGAVTGAFSYALNHSLHQRKSCSGQMCHGSVSGDKRSLWEKLTSWHFEGRDARNAKFESLSLEGVSNSEEWSEMSGVQASAHQYPNTKSLDRKFIHNSSGAELVFNGDTGALLTNPAYKGTYNYINAVAWKDVGGPLSFGAFVVKGAGNFAVDYVPWVLGGNVRGDE